jgi:predicted DNA-binding transcriptional regulator AlpA
METIDLEKKLITEDELCRMLGISRITSWRLRKTGKLSFTKLDKGIRYTHAQVRDFLRARARGFSAPAQAA